ncbi:hypothetical protein [Methylorubrum sp. DB1722]|uniref:hypothetical protein n=1 Tax=Methylorubrum sp. DB1722 TaxID=2478916 RepID=UPI0018E33D24|nr:hypothetical protein [Methylorubrum sp. DB1722]
MVHLDPVQARSNIRLGSSGETGIGPLLLLIEPEPVVGLDLADALRGAGLRVFGPLPDAASGLTLLPHVSPNYVVIGLLQGDEAGANLIVSLRLRSIPFVAHGSPDATGGVPVGALLYEPVLAQDIVASVLALPDGRAE